MIILFSFIRHRIYGKSNLKHINQPVIFVANHSSFMDVPLIEVVLGSRPRIWLSRRLFGLNGLLKRMHVIIERKGHSDAKYALARTIQLARKHNSDIVIFPEGTRHADGKMHKFFSGFAMMAQDLNYPIVPIAISGINKIFPPNSFLIDSNVQIVKISIGNMIRSKDFYSQKELVTHVEEWFEQELLKLNSEKLKRE